jgi:hypothetical protein
MSCTSYHLVTSIHFNQEFGLISCYTHVTIFILLVQVIMGEEIATLWKFFHYQKFLNVMMPSFDVIYVVGNAGSTIVEVGTMDYGGPTKCVLSTTLVWLISQQFSKFQPQIQNILSWYDMQGLKKFTWLK